MSKRRKITNLLLSFVLAATMVPVVKYFRQKKEPKAEPVHLKTETKTEPIHLKEIKEEPVKPSLVSIFSKENPSSTDLSASPKSDAKETDTPEQSPSSSLTDVSQPEEAISSLAEQPVIPAAKTPESISQPLLVVDQEPQTVPEIPTEPEPLGPQKINYILQMAYMPFCAVGENKKDYFYRCSEGKITIGYGCNVQADPKRLDGIDIFFHFNRDSVVDLAKKVKQTINPQKKMELLQDIFIDGTQQTPDGFIQKIGDILDTYKDSKDEANKILSELLRVVRVKRKLNPQERQTFINDMCSLPKERLESYGINEKDARGMYSSMFNTIMPKVAEFLSDEKGNSFFYDLPFQWQLVCLDIAYQRGHNGFCEFRKLKEALAAKDYTAAAKQIGTRDPRRLAIRQVILKQGEIVFKHLFGRDKNKGANPYEPDYIQQIIETEIMNPLEIKNMKKALDSMWNYMTGVVGLVSQSQLNQFSTEKVQTAPHSLKTALKAQHKSKQTPKTSTLVTANDQGQNN